MLFFSHSKLIIWIHFEIQKIRYFGDFFSQSKNGWFYPIYPIEIWYFLLFYQFHYLDEYFKHIKWRNFFFKTPCANINIIVIIKLQDDGKKKKIYNKILMYISLFMKHYKINWACISVLHIIFYAITHYMKRVYIIYI